MNQQEAKQILKNWKTLFYAEQFDKGIEQFQLAKTFYKKEQNWNKYIKATYRLGYFYINEKLSNLEKGKTEIEEALQLGKKLKGNTSDEVMNSYQILSIYYIKKYTPELAFKCIKKAVDICTKLYGEKSIQQALMYKTIANIHLCKREHKTAIHYHHKSLTIYQEILGEEYLEVAFTYNQIGGEHAEGGDLSTAKSFLQKALHLYLQILPDQHILIAKTYINLGVISGRGSQWDSSKIYLEKAFKTLNQMEGYEKYLAVCCNNLGALCRKKNEYKSAEMWFEESLSLQSRYIGEICRLGLNNYFGLAALYAEQKKYQKAENYIVKSIEIGTKLTAEFHPDMGYLYSSLGNIYLETGNLIKGITYYQKSLKCLSPSFNPNHIYDNPMVFNENNAIALIENLAVKASGLWILYSQGNNIEDLQASHDTHQLVLNWIDQVRQGYETEDSKLILLNNRNTIRAYIRAFLSSLAQYHIHKNQQYLESAFQAVEKSRANILLGQLKDIQSKVSANIPNELLQKETTLKVKLTQVKSNIRRLQSQSESKQYEISQLQAEYFDYEQEYKHLIQNFETDYPDYYQLKHQVETVTIENLQSKLPSNTALIEYFIGEKNLYTFLITSNNIQVVEVVKPTDFKDLVEAFKASIDEIDKMEYIELAFELYQLLIAPILEYPISNNQYRIANLKIIPSGILSTIPFEALLTQEVTANAKYADLPYLLLQYDISYHYSATLWSQAQVEQTSIHSPKNKQNESSFIGFAPVYKSEQKPTLEETTTRGIYNKDSTRSIQIGAETFSELIYSEEEVNTIESYFQNQNIPTQTFLHAQANTSNFLQNVGKHKYVLISAHGFYNEKQPDLTGFILSPPINQTSPNPSDVGESSGLAKNSPSSARHGDVRSERSDKNIFYLSDAYNLELNADLVVLSCCETGVGKLAKGEGVMALNRGFFYAGAKNVIYTLFKVYDQASCQLTKHLFQQILESKGYSSALKEAKRKLILQGKAPIHWAGYLLIGE